MKRLILFFLLVPFLLLSTQKAQAYSKSAGTSAVLASNFESSEDDYRVRTLKAYLMQYDAPLAPYADRFVAAADKYNLDWRFVASISGLESGFGKHIPYNSYNGWGWGIYGDNSLSFKSWEDGIDTVSEGLRTKYMDKWGAENIWEIGAIYASSPTWAVRVQGFMNQIEAFRLRNPQTALSISI